MRLGEWIPDRTAYGITIYDESTAKKENGTIEAVIFSITFGDGGKQGVTDSSEYFEIRTERDLERDIWITDIADKPSSHLREDHAQDIAY